MSSDIARDMIIAYANKTNTASTTKDVYWILKGKPKSTVRKLLAYLTKENKLTWVGWGIYKIAPTNKLGTVSEQLRV